MVITAIARGRVEPGRWIETYGRAWQSGDDELTASLFAEDATYRSAPFRHPFRGHHEIRGYARRNAGTQRDTHVRMGPLFSDGSRVAGEWWTSMIAGGEAVLPAVSSSASTPTADAASYGSTGI